MRTKADGLNQRVSSTCLHRVLLVIYFTLCLLSNFLSVLRINIVYGMRFCIKYVSHILKKIKIPSLVVFGKGQLQEKEKESIYSYCCSPSAASIKALLSFPCRLSIKALILFNSRDTASCVSLNLKQ